MDSPKDLWSIGVRTIEDQEPQMSNKQRSVGYIRFALAVSLSVLKMVIEETKLKCLIVQESEV